MNNQPIPSFLIPKTKKVQFSNKNTYIEPDTQKIHLPNTTSKRGAYSSK